MASVRKRTWVHKGENKTAWVVNYTDASGKRRLKTFDKKKDADLHRTKVETELGDGTHIPISERQTVKAICEEYLRYSDMRLADGRIGRKRHQNIKFALEGIILPELGRRNFCELSALDIEEVYRKLIAKGQKPATGKTRLRVLAGVEDFALKRRYVTRPAVREALKELRGTVDKPIRTFTADEALHLLRIASVRKKNGHARNALMLECFVHLAALCGLRWGEIQGLTVESIDFHRMILRIRHSLNSYDELKGPKTQAGIRDVPLPKHIADLLAQWLRGHYRPDDRGLIFRSRFGSKVESGNFHSHMWGDLLALAGLDKGERYHFHALRHFAASWMIENGLPVTEVALLMGHKKFDMTLQVYAHPVVSSSQRHAAVERMTSNLLAYTPTADATRTRHGQLTY